MARPIPELRDVMTGFPQVVQASQPLHVARELMRTKGIRHLPVYVGEELFGLLSSRELEVAYRVHDDPATIAVGQICSHPPFVVDVDARLDAVAFDMANQKTGSALVADGGDVVGIITTTDLARALGERLRAARSELSQYARVLRPSAEERA